MEHRPSQCNGRPVLVKPFTAQAGRILADHDFNKDLIHGNYWNNRPNLR